MTIDKRKIDSAIIERARLAKIEHRAAEKALSAAVLAASPYKKNDVIRDTDTGVCYRVASGWGSFNLEHINAARFAHMSSCV